jgi:hypothetical protein
MIYANPRQYVAPNGAAIVETLERVTATNGILGIYADGTPEYDSAGSRVHWDSQVQVTRKGQPVFLDENGDEWLFSQLRLAPRPVRKWLKRRHPVAVVSPSAS